MYNLLIIGAFLCGASQEPWLAEKDDNPFQSLLFIIISMDNEFLSQPNDIVYKMPISGDKVTCISQQFLPHDVTP